MSNKKVKKFWSQPIKKSTAHKPFVIRVVVDFVKENRLWLNKSSGGVGFPGLQNFHIVGPFEGGRFGAMMEVELVNDGPVTFMLDSVDGVKK